MARGTRKLDDSMVSLIRAEYANLDRPWGYFEKKARELNVSRSTIARVVRGTIYANLPVLLRKSPDLTDELTCAIRRAVTAVCGITERELLHRQMGRFHSGKAQHRARRVVASLLFNELLWSTTAICRVLKTSPSSIKRLATKPDPTGEIKELASLLLRVLETGYGRDWWTIGDAKTTGN